MEGVETGRGRGSGRLRTERQGRLPHTHFIAVGNKDEQVFRELLSPRHVVPVRRDLTRH